MTLSRETIFRVAQKQDQVRAQQQAQVSAFQIQLQHEAHIAELARVGERRNALLASATALMLADETTSAEAVAAAMKLMDEVDRQCDARGAEDAKAAEAGTAPVDGGTLKP